MLADDSADPKAEHAVPGASPDFTRTRPVSIEK
jgi:hypothetical protein